MLSKTEKPSKEQTEYRANNIELNEKTQTKLTDKDVDVGLNEICGMTLKRIFSSIG